MRRNDTCVTPRGVATVTSVWVGRDGPEYMVRIETTGELVRFTASEIAEGHAHTEMKIVPAPGIETELFWRAANASRKVPGTVTSLADWHRHKKKEEPR